MNNTVKSMSAIAATLITFGSLAGRANGAITFNFTNKAGGLTLTTTGTYNLTGATAISPRYSFISGGSAGYANGTFDIMGFDTLAPTNTDTAYSLTLISGSRGGFASNLGFSASSTTTAPSQAFYFLDRAQDFQIVFNGLLTSGSASGSAVWSGQTIASAGLIDGYLATYLINGTSETITISVNGAIPEPSSALLLGVAGLTFVTRRRK